ATDLDIVIAFTDWCWIYGLMSIAVLLPLSIGGIGIRDGSLIGLLSYMGISADRSLALSLLLFFFMFIVAVAGGGVEIIRIIQMRTDGSS
ncbi:MAG: flippase-like domain-containing protein, partial [Chitinispirillaceae bacterium]|nr:flippase-like domain-containing protein [Chitinispirillaceae bacterium]